jgi:hypothetical protein
VKFILILLFISITKFSFAQSKNFIDTTKYSIQVNQSFLSIANYSWFTNYLDTTKKYYDFLLATGRNIKEYHEEYSFIRLSQNYDTLLKKIVVFTFPVESIVEASYFFFVVHSDKSTMGDPSKTFLAKYDKNWKRIWIKNINKDISPDDNIVMTLNNRNQLLIFSTTYSRKTKKSYRVIEKRDQNGNLIKSTMTKQTLLWTPHNIIKTFDNTFLLTCTLFDVEKQINKLFLMKLNEDGDTISTKIYTDIYPTQTLIKRDGDVIIYGINYERIPNTNGESKNNLKILCLKSDGNLTWEKTLFKTNIAMAGSVSETNDNSLIFSSVINPKFGWIQKSYVFELNNKGEIIYEKVIDTNATSLNKIILKKSSSLILSNSIYRSDWYKAHNCTVQFLRLTKNE